MRIEIWLDILAVVDISGGDSCATISLVATGLRLNNRRPIERLTQSNRIDPIIPNGSYLECVIEIDTALLTENGMKKKKKIRRESYGFNESSRNKQEIERTERIEQSFDPIEIFHNWK